MIRLITSRRLTALEADCTRLRQDAAAQVEQQHTLQLDLEHAQKRAASAEFEAETADQIAAKLRGEVSELVEEVQAAEQRAESADAEVEALRAELATAAVPECVFVLLRRGELHSAHPTHAAARAFAVRCGAHPTGWVPASAGESPAGSDWFICRLPLHADSGGESS